MILKEKNLQQLKNKQVKENGQLVIFIYVIKTAKLDVNELKNMANLDIKSLCENLKKYNNDCFLKYFLFRNI